MPSPPLRVSALFALAGCADSSGKKAPPVPEQLVYENEYGRVELQPETRLPEEMEGYVSATVTVDTVVVIFDDEASAEAADIDSQDVVVGSVDDGYLRRVLAVTVEGRELHLETGPAVLADALVEADFTIDTELDGEWEVVPLEGDAPAPPNGTVTLDVGALDFGTVSLLEGTASVALESLRMEVAPTFRWTERIVDGREELADVALYVDVVTESDLVLSTSGTVALTGSREFKKLKRRQLVWIGYLPIVMVHSLTFTGNAGLDAEGAGELRTPMVGEGNVTVQSRKVDEQWGFDHSAGFTLQPGDPSADIEAQVELRTGLAVKAATNGYGVAGVYGAVEPYVQGTVCTPGGWSVDAGVDAEVGVDLLWMEHDEQEKDLWDWSGPTSTLADGYKPDYYADIDGDGYADEEIPFDYCDTEVDWIYVDRAEGVYDCDDESEDTHPDVSPEIVECEAAKDLNCDEEIEPPLAVHWSYSAPDTYRITASDVCPEGGYGVNTAWVVPSSGTWTTFAPPPEGHGYLVSGTYEVIHETTTAIVCTYSDGSTSGHGWGCYVDNCTQLSDTRFQYTYDFTWYGSPDECDTGTHSWDAGVYGTARIDTSVDWF